MQSADVEEWFAAYLETYAAAGRGELDDLAALLEYYAIPLLVTADAGAIVLGDAEGVVAAVAAQVEGMRETGFHRSDVVTSDVEVLNESTALYRGSFARKRQDGSEIERLQTTYLIVDGEQGRRIAALVVTTS